jgi:DNA-binding NtrC family response regulator
VNDRRQVWLDCSTWRRGPSMYDQFLGVVVLIEDEPLVRFVVADVLVDGKFCVIEADNAEEALTVLQAGVEADVLLSDVEMSPGINGYELARQVHEHWPTIEILIMSGREWPKAGDLPPGAAFVAKPCPSEALLSHVRSAAERAQAARSYRAARGERDAVPDGTVVPFPKIA